ncbi:methyltransferase domain-containing protein [Pseudonocardia nematodicida]|uniref:Methyltransferase domain-containing protein n=1 Tax=Pseudonocardia nematodicida TaxID=1206997 RepID=A0ABV1K9B4_9PSEU
MKDWDAESAVLAARALAEGRPTGWFEELYAAGERGETTVPWNRTAPAPQLTDWVPTLGDPDGRRAVVVGCGLGGDAEFVAAAGFTTTAFDIAPTAVATARGRYPGSPVDYRVADLLDLPDEWARAFDVVVEIINVQALPVSLRPAATAAVAALVAPGGDLLVVENVRGDGDPPSSRPPWAFTRAEITAFAGHGLEPVSPARSSGLPVRWTAVFRRKDRKPGPE